VRGVAVLVPWAGSCAHRVAAWGYVHSWYERNHPTWKIIRGHGRSGAQWCKAQAVADALSRTRADVLVVADADVIAPDIGRAVREVTEGSPWAIPHDKLHRLTEEATRQVLRGADPQAVCAARTSLTQAPYRGYAGGGITVVRRHVYGSTPLDPRFLGWGQEDESWATALTLMHGQPWRSTGPMWHLWHPPQARISRTTGSHGSRQLAQQYRRIHSKAGMERFLAPARELIGRSVAVPG
jgi:hypothetical protein